MKKRILFTIFIFLVGFLCVCNDAGVYAKEKKKSKTYIVSQDGMGDCVTIQEAVNKAKDGDTLVIYPGIYVENVEVMGKSLNLQGIDKDRCILQYDATLYNKVPLTIAAGKVSNITIYGNNTGVKAKELTTQEILDLNSKLIGDSWERQKNYSGYAIHIDQNCLYGKSLEFNNCRILSSNNYCAGIGTRGKSIIIFENCEFTAMGSGGCIYFHDPTSYVVGGESEFVIKDCYMTSYLSPYVMTFQSFIPENITNLTFQNVHISGVAYEDLESYQSCNLSTSLEVDKLTQLALVDMYGNTASLVQEMPQDSSCEYLYNLEVVSKTGNPTNVLQYKLPEGISYIGSMRNVTSDKNRDVVNVNKKRQLIAIYNASGEPGNGWCGSENVYLTSSSYGNTFIEMNADTIQTEANNTLNEFFED